MILWLALMLVQWLFCARLASGWGLSLIMFLSFIEIACEIGLTLWIVIDLIFGDKNEK